MSRLHLPGLAPLLLAVTAGALGLLVVMPLGVVFTEAFDVSSDTLICSPASASPQMWMGMSRCRTMWLEKSLETVTVARAGTAAHT